MEPGPDATGEPTNPGAGPATVLVVDDDEAVRDSIAALLAVSGYRILTAADGEEALRLLHREAVDVMVLDLWMPRRDGVSVLNDLPLRAPAVIVNTATEDVSAEIPPEILQAKVFLSLRKPVSPGILLSAVSEAVNHVPTQWPVAHQHEVDHAGAPAVPREHCVTRAVIRSGNRWFAHLSCECGWSHSVGPIADEQRLDTAMDAAQRAHQSA